MLTIHQISMVYGAKTALHPLSHDFLPGQWTHIIGPNGAGKSTLLKLLACLIRPTSGHILLDNADPLALPPKDRARKIAYIPQRLEAVPSLTVFELVSQGTYAWIKRETNTENAQKVIKSLHSLGIESLANRRINTLSGGELQLCVLASALAQDASILLLDEPTSALDLHHAEVFCQAVAQLKSKGMTIISTTHDLSQAARYADECLLLCEGKCLYQTRGFPNAEQLASAYPMPTQAFERFCSLTRADIVQKTEVQNQPLQAPKRTIPWAPFAAAVVLLAVFCPFLGATQSTPFENSDIFFNLRIPRVLWGALAGATLSVVGGVLQALFQNPLASPYTLGIASGASLGAMAAIQLGVAAVWLLPFSACAGGLLCMAAVLAIATRSNMRQPIICLMAGVAASMFCTAAGLIIQAFATPLTAQQMMRWQLGGLEIVGYTSFAACPIILIAIIALFALHRPINLMSVDADLAATRGVNVPKIRTAAILATGIATSLVVSICGPIGFVGLIIPNAIRRWTGANLKKLLPLSALIGASFLMLADTGSRILERLAWIPVGVITAIIGAPIFVIALLRHRSEF